MNGHQASTAYGYMARCKSLFKFCVDNKWLDGSPMATMKLSKAQKKVEIITEAEYRKIRDKRFDIPRLEKVRKLFILACNCGLAYADLMLLTKEDLKEKDGIKYIQKNRKKTGVEYTAVILDDGINIINEIESLKMSNQKLNGYLKEIKDLCKIEHPLTMHKARHYYCSRLIQAGVSPAIVQKALGHSKINTTIAFYTHLSSDSVIKNIKEAMF
jgi:site-specific recombinase XerD